MLYNQGSTSGTGSSGSHGPSPGTLGRGPGLIIKSGTGSGTRIQNLRDSRPRLEILKSGIRDWEWHPDFSQLKIFWDMVPGTKKIRHSVPGTENFLAHASGPVPTPVHSPFKWKKNKFRSCKACKLHHQSCDGCSGLFQIYSRSISEYGWDQCSATPRAKRVRTQHAHALHACKVCASNV